MKIERILMKYSNEKVDVKIGFLTWAMCEELCEVENEIEETNKAQMADLYQMGRNWEELKKSSQVWRRF